MIRVTENLRKIRDLLAKAAADAGRDPQTVRLLAVSKKQPLDRINEAIAAGQRHFGENQVQEGIEKVTKIDDPRLTWHFIGHLQTNKTRTVAEHFAWVHSVDRLKIARRLSEQRPEELPDLNICIQVNVDEEASKSGATIAETVDLARAIAELPRLKLRGLMCLPAIRHGFEQQRLPFRRLRGLADDLRANGMPVDTLSMGMTDDYRAAIFEGSTIVRIGTAVFGARTE
ncbi:MAG: YggS family pyridoxal phosphate-dependent enzyme [Woeseiaceae bacterium]|nr:YggS family pyridoxal phosphate-dependent enzyme [Woeseiaceae bacterium]NIP20487.1 YggS family pyridoxal phosphate-dependent enzyme [Woeseiaceae bacterium]NIS89082.1 YggS family pyridoxal phosphate-dependent enzyme [Woeseiaceae bacterium]